MAVITRDHLLRTAKTVVVDQAIHDAHNHDLAADAATATCHACTVLILAHSLRTTPVTITFDDPAQESVALTSEKPQVRALQCYEDATLLARAVKTAKAAQAAAVYVLAPAPDQGALAEKIAEEAKAAGADGVIPFDPIQSDALDAKSGYFEVCNVSAWMLSLGQKLVEQTPGADALLVMGVDQPRLEPKHLNALVQRQQECPQAEVAASWITWLRRLPLLFTPAFFEALPSLLAQRTDPSATYTPLPQLQVEDVVFGEEKLAPSGSAPQGYQDFFDGLTLDALGAVRLARTLAALKGAEDAEEKQAALLKPLSEQDKLLLSFAQETIEQQANNPELTWADQWARRNKLDFPLFAARKHRDHLVYLDSAATTQRCQQALTAMNVFDTEENANVYRGAYDLSMQATFTFNDARAVLESFIGAQRRETIFTSNTSTAANLVAQAWGDANISTGDLIVCSQSDHHSNILPWLLLAQRKGARLAYLPCCADGRLDQEAYAQVLSQRPRLVCLTHISNVLGLVNPVKEMTAQAKEVGARVFIDGAQAAPHVAIDVQDLGTDFYALSAHKMYGPQGLGALWVNPEALAEMRPVAGGGGIISHESFASYYLRLGAIGYEVGTPPISQAIGFAAALNYLQTLGMDQVDRHSRALTQYLVESLSRLEFVSLWGDHCGADGGTGLVSFSVPGVSPNEVAVCLGKLGVAVRSGGHCAIPLSALMGAAGTTRISLGVYNTVEDLDAALVALRACWNAYHSEHQPQE